MITIEHNAILRTEHVHAARFLGARGNLRLTHLQKCFLQRSERLGWMGDAQVFGRASMLIMNMAAFYTNFLRDIHDIQLTDGTVPDTVPYRNGRRPGRCPTRTRRCEASVARKLLQATPDGGALDSLVSVDD